MEKIMEYTVGTSPSLLKAYLLRANAELVLDGFCDDPVIVNERNVLVAEQSGKHVSVLVYSVYDDYVWIHLSHTEKEMRNEGLNGKLWDHLVAIAKDHGKVGSIQCGVKTINVRMHEVAHSRGMDPDSTVYAYPIT